jgi:hypothetical protein
VCAAFTLKVTSASLQSVNDVGYGNRGKTWKKKKEKHVRALTFISLAEERQRVSAASQHLPSRVYGGARAEAAAPAPPQLLLYTRSSWTTLQQQKL